MGGQGPPLRASCEEGGWTPTAGLKGTVLPTSRRPQGRGTSDPALCVRPRQPQGSGRHGWSPGSQSQARHPEDRALAYHSGRVWQPHQWGKGGSGGALGGPRAKKRQEPEADTSSLDGNRHHVRKQYPKQTQRRGSQAGQEETGDQPRAGSAFQLPLSPLASPRPTGSPTASCSSSLSWPGSPSKIGQVTYIRAAGSLYRV